MPQCLTSEQNGAASSQTGETADFLSRFAAAVMRAHKSNLHDIYLLAQPTLLVNEPQSDGCQQESHAQPEKPMLLG